MNFFEWIKQAMVFFQEVEPGVKSAAEVGAIVGPVMLKVLYQGRQIITYLATQRKAPPTEAEATPAVSRVVDVEPVPEGQPLVGKQDVALLVDINRRLLHDVSRYLEAHNIDADVIIMTNDPEYSDAIKFVDPTHAAAWTELVQDFNTAINKIKYAVGSARVHIFLSVPLPLAFGLGAVWGTVDNATVYHWQEGTYHPAMCISRGLRAPGCSFGQG